jgi:hypothetical protein
MPHFLILICPKGPETETRVSLIVEPVPQSQDSTAPASPERTRWIFAATIFLSAFLLFQVQLIISKYILPWFGGSAAVWTTNMLVFQLLLLAGYLYSHFLSEKLSVPAQTKLHLALLGIALVAIIVLSVAWPSAIMPSAAFQPRDAGHPVRDVIFVTLLATGLPFFVLSTTGPLLQRWFAQTGGDAGTYRLYAVSNLGSLVGLLAFPLVLEPLLRLKTQGILWSLLFVFFCAGCAWCARRPSQSQAPANTRTASNSSKSRRESNSLIPGYSYLLWFLLAACASSLFLATTNQLCQEIISLPLLWVVPLAVYLLSFILCFDHPRWYRREIFHPLFAVGIFVLCAAMIYAQRTVQLTILPLLLFVACMICHGELACLKPPVHRLTAFYLALSAGGAFGGIFVAFMAPHLFRFFTEFQLSLGACAVLLLACLFSDEDSWIYSSAFWFPCTITVGCVIIAAAMGSWIPAFGALLQSSYFYAWAFLAAALFLSGAYIRRGSPARRPGFRFVQPLVGLVTILALFSLYASDKPEPGLYLGERNFYGALRIFELEQGGKALFHAHTLHGAQLNPPYDRLPLAYYGPDSGIGILLQNRPLRINSAGNLRIGVVGLGAGTLAAYGRPGDYFRYYEINPQVIALSRGSHPVFTYVRDSAARIDMQLGDARLLLQQEAAKGDSQRFDILVLDAFSGDAVPVHLLTKEAFDIYAQHLRDDNAIIALHLSSRHINLLPVVEGLRQYTHTYSLVKFTDGRYPFLENLWVFLAKRPESLQVPGLFPALPPSLPPAQPRLWTDDYSDIFRLLY